jgi:hypothetical protein
LSGRCLRICRVTAIIDSRSSVAAESTSVITKVYLGKYHLSRKSPHVVIDN